ncbi:MAG: twin-arginine translocase TatA/TatE family subunit [Actinomycetota bacterium]|jgi:Tat protein translocase TatB subunit|nr:twin-arginine translocase TatA/TatE family subunit [Actinomycetota bacterium]
MFGVGGQEIVIIGIIALVIFGPSSLPKMARDIGRFVSEARRSIDEFKEELTSVEDDEEDDKKSRKRSRKDRDKDETNDGSNAKADQDEHDL